MFFLVSAIAAHVGNALVFVIDKGILGSDGAISNPARYAAYSGLAGALAGVIFVVAPAAPNTFIVGWSLLAGALWVGALWAFFIALKGGESSRVVPIIGSAVPFFTLLLAATFLGERLSIQELSASLLLITGGALLAIRFARIRALPASVIIAAVAGGALFAAYFALVKHIYAGFDPFLSAFSYTRIGVGVVSLALLLALMARDSRGAQKNKKKRGARKKTIATGIAFVSSKGLGTIALILQNYAISIGSVSVVNALQGTQYAFVLLFAAAASRWLPNLLKEELGRVALTQKVAGIIVVSLGLIVLVI